MAKVSVIVPAAGAGKRYGAKANKIFERLKGQPVFIRTLELFTGRDDVCQVQMVVSAEDLDMVKESFGGALGFMGVGIVVGGPTRAHSVRNALARVTAEADLVCVHDAVRPCLSQVWVSAVFDAAAKYGAAMLANPLHGTLKRVSAQGEIEETVPRDGLWEAQTPQVFSRSLLQKAYEGDLSNVTDDAQLVEALGQKVHVVPGDPRNIKITSPADLAVVAAVIDSLPKPKLAGGDHPFAEAKW
ncbi:MAG: 2-C-methyl-D-erythritol 4-phosphate cytidylyltransferase [Planctomycetes bacterium]|jgi:2-C-methyl-D-erythritol 4-phosphate cytidylyltransferase|nr:2-C-methyl-D-erythritol 4-phosphate cytidylyltransferase [Planctomycetota bacterium]